MSGKYTHSAGTKTHACAFCMRPSRLPCMQKKKKGKESIALGSNNVFTVPAVIVPCGHSVVSFDSCNVGSRLLLLPLSY